MIDFPLPFKEAIEFILNKQAVPTDEWDPDLLRGEEKDVALRAFWSSRVENARFLDRAQAFLFDTIAGTTEQVVGPDGVERTALRGGGRATFVRRMREFMIREGMVANEEEFFDVNNNDVTDIRSESRLRLIYDTTIRQAYGYGQWKQGQRPGILYRWPAQKFVRVRKVGVERERHDESEGEIRLKSDTAYWADYQNDPAIGGFGVPWSPFGFHSGMDVRDVDREKAIDQGLKVDSVKPDLSKNLNTNLQASIKKMSPEVKKKLIDELRSFKPKDAGKAGRDAALRVREQDDVLRIKEAPSDSPAIGSDVSSKIKSKSKLTKAASAAFQRAKNAIDFVHGDGPLKPIELTKKGRMGTVRASYSPWDGDYGITLRSMDAPEVSIVHEMGHWLDHQAFWKGAGEVRNFSLSKDGGNLMKLVEKNWGSYGEEFAEFRKAVKNSGSYKTIKDDDRLSTKQKTYLLSDHETFARAYAQWIAIESGNEVMIRQIEKSLVGWKEGKHSKNQWEESDFELIKKALRDIFIKRNWLRI